MIRPLVCTLLLAAGCYRPQAEDACTVSCAVGEMCPNGLSCEDGLCRDMTRPCTDGGKDPDAVVEPVFDAAPGCFGRTSLFSFCPPVLSSMNIVFTMNPQLINTDSSGLCEPSVMGFCVVVFKTITIANNATVRGVGSRPLVLLATESMTISPTAVVDVASVLPADVGAGGTLIACPSSSPGSSVPATSAGGGAGGTFGGRGGDGGDVGTGNLGEAATNESSYPATLHGGCAGSMGGGGSAAGFGGAGGGAVALISGGMMVVQGRVRAYGAGGAGGGNVIGYGGGGGGGAGGMILIDAEPVVLAGSVLVASGGGGGGGGPTNNTGGSGSMGGTPSAGGPGGNNTGGKGGTGSNPLTGDPGANVPQPGAGGGGGGGAGVIKIVGTQNGIASVIAPPPT